MMNGDALVKPEEMEFGQVADIISDGQSYRSILTGRSGEGHKAGVRHGAAGFD